MKINIITKRLIFFVLLFTFFILNNLASKDNDNKIRFGVWVDYPSVYYDKDGELSGFEIELFKSINFPNDIDIKIYDDYNACINALRNNEIDVVQSNIFSKEISNEFEFNSLMVRHVDIVLVSTKEDLYYQDYEILNNKKIGYINKGEVTKQIFEILEDKIENPNYKLYDNLDELKLALKTGELEYAFIGLSQIEDYLNIIDRFLALPAFYITRKNESLELNNILSRYYNNLFEEYVNLYNKYYPRANITEFSEKEYDYINSKPDINLLILGDKNVLSSVDKNGNPIGVCIDIVKKINETSGLNLNINIVDNHDIFKNEALNQSVDMIIGLNNATILENKENYLYSETILTIPMEFIIKPSTILDKEKIQKIAISREGCISYKYIKENYPNWEIIYEPKLENRYELLSKDKVDCIIDLSYSFNYMKSKWNYSKFVSSPINLYDSYLNIIVVKDNIELSSIINKTLVQIKKESLDEIIQENIMNIKYEKTIFDYFMIHLIDFILVFIVIAFLIFIIYFLSSSRRRKQLEQSNKELHAAKIKLKKADDAKNIFLAKMCHDMRTPLGAVIAISEFGKNESNEKKLESYFSEINDSSQYLLSLMDDILDTQRLQQEDFEFNYNIVDFNKIVSRINTIVENRAKEKNIDLQIINYLNIKDRLIVIDDKRLAQVYINILNNAIKYTPKNGKIVWENRLDIISNKDVKLHSTIKDNGVGISKEFVKKYLFKPFVQEENTQSSQEGGSGLGLSICKKIIDQMNGDIYCESQLGEGTTFSLDFIIPSIVVNKKNRTKEIKYDDSVFVNKKMLVCDDTEINIKIVKKILESKFIKVDIANNGKEAINKIKLNEYDAVLMDIRMPIMDGLEATREIRKFNTSLPIIAYSANAYSNDREKSLEAGMIEHLAKPIDINKLFEILYKIFK